MGQEGAGAVRRRRVLYLPGYDPLHPRRYRELYRREAALQAAHSGHAIRLIARPAGGVYGWRVEAEIEGRAVTTELDVLVWTDIVRESMRHGLLTPYRQLVRAAAVFFGTGAVFRLARLRKGPMIAGFFPAVFLAGTLALGAGAALAVAAGLAALLPPAGWAAAAATVAAGLALWGVLAAAARLHAPLYVDYLMNDFAFSAGHRGAYPPEVAARLDGFVAHAAAALAEDVDEVLIVGHSIGTHLAVSLLAALLRRGLIRPGGPAVGLLTLGQTIPMMSFLPDALRLRADLRLVATAAGITWVDVSAPADGACFALCDPVAVSGVAPAGRRWPLVISCAFSQTLAPATWTRLRRRFFRLHFQYLCAFDAIAGRPGAYDYFAITAGPQTLAARFAGRAPSQSRIERPASGHTALAPEPVVASAPPAP